VKLVCAARESSLVWAVITNTIGSPPEIFWGEWRNLIQEGGGASTRKTKLTTPKSRKRFTN
jgi:hypothetical protein